MNNDTFPQGPQKGSPDKMPSSSGGGSTPPSKSGFRWFVIAVSVAVIVTVLGIVASS